MSNAPATQWELNEHGLWCPACGDHIAAPWRTDEPDFEPPESCKQCGFPEFEEGPVECGDCGAKGPSCDAEESAAEQWNVPGVLLLKLMQAASKTAQEKPE